jgi:hypothetical protein
MAMRWIPAAIVATALLLSLAATGCEDGDDADAAATDAGDTASIVVSGEAPFTIPDKSQAVVTDFWNAARMRAAVPYEAGGGKAAEGETADEADLELPPPDTACVTSAQSCRNGTGAYAYTRGPEDAATPPGRLVGKLFFTISGKPYECSGSIAESRNRSVVWTAGHCVAEDGKFHANWIFAPAYKDGSAPLGRWVPRPGGSTFTLRPWLDDTDWRYDLGAVVVATADGTTLADRAGGSLPLVFDQAPAADDPVEILGYPGQAPFDGSDLERCDARVAERDEPPWPELVAWYRAGADGPLPEAEPGDPSGYRVGCDQTGGSSGGPLLVDGDDGDPSVFSVVSHGPVTVATGPYMGSDARGLWDTAQAFGG